MEKSKNIAIDVLGYCGESRGVVFDFDGTLCQMNVDFDKMKKELSDYAKNNFNIDSLFTPLLKELDRVSGLIDAPSMARLSEIVECYEAAGVKRGRSHPDFVDFISKNSDNRNPLKVAVFTLNRSKTISLFIECHELQGKVDTVVAYEHVNRYKPDPEGLKIVLDHWGFASGDVLYFGDSNGDCLAGEALGVETNIRDWFGE